MFFLPHLPLLHNQQLTHLLPQWIPLAMPTAPSPPLLLPAFRLILSCLPGSLLLLSLPLPQLLQLVLLLLQPLLFLSGCSPLQGYQQINSPAPAHGLPVVSPQQEQSILTSLSLPSALQLDMAISPFPVGAAMPTAARVVQICQVPEFLYGRVKLEMYPTQVQRTAVMRMWRAFPWKRNKEIDVKKFVSKELNNRFHQSKRSAEKNQAKLAATTALTSAANHRPDATLAGTLPHYVVSSGISATSLPTASGPAPAASSLSASSSLVAAWSDPDVHLARSFLGEVYWNAVDYAIADDGSGAFSNWGEVPAVAVLLQDWMLNLEQMEDQDEN
ncbi:hypothetical protein FPQ18DRAFT_308950 [Pyronema domesticum]|nr:hypothetical protein FPQ18DRAFT_308950 [Pyronema domesticum]